MTSIPFAFALTAGMISVFNPCGFSLLPAYIGLFVAGDDQGSRLDRRIGRALVAAACVTVGFVTVFTILGLALGSIVSGVREQLPWVAIVIGGMLIVAGLATIVGRNLRLVIPIPGNTRRGGPAGMVLFGMVYAVTSLACSIGPFLAVTTVAMNRTVLAGVLAHATYAMGMGLVILGISTLAALARPGPLRILRRLSGWAQPIGGAVMVLAGGYAIWYGRWELAVYRGDLSDDRVVNAGERLRFELIQFVERVGAVRLAGMIVVVIVVLALTASLWRKGRNTLTG